MRSENFNPISKDVNDDELLKILNTPTKKKWFCIHNWIYWSFGSATRAHRVCTKCFKKQQHFDVLSQGSLFLNWVKCHSFFNKK